MDHLVSCWIYTLASLFRIVALHHSKSKMQSLSTDDFLNEPLRRIGCDDLKFPEEDEADFPTLIGHEDTPFCKNTVFNNNFNADFYPFGSKAFPTLLDHEDTSFGKNTVFNNNFNDDFYPFGSKSSSLCDDESVIQKNDQAFNNFTEPLADQILSHPNFDEEELSMDESHGDYIPTARFLSNAFTEQTRDFETEPPTLSLRKSHQGKLSSTLRIATASCGLAVSGNLSSEFRHDLVLRRVGHAHTPIQDKFSLPSVNLSPRTTAILSWEMETAESSSFELLSDVSSQSNSSNLFNFDEGLTNDPEDSKYLSSEDKLKKHSSSTSNEHDSNINEDGLLISCIEYQHRSLVTEFTNNVVSELELATFSERDRKGNRTKIPIGFKGMACRHCKGNVGKTGRYFPSSIKTLADSKKTLFAINRHLAKCSHCPEEIKENIRRSFKSHIKDLNEKSKKRHGSQRAYFRKIWDSMHPHA